MSKSAEIRRHWDALREYGCIITRSPDPTIHHCHGGSMLERGVTRGMGRKTSDWLVIPLALDLHSMGPNAIDGGMGVRSWEAVYGEQAAYLDVVCEITGTDVWAKAGIERCA